MDIRGAFRIFYLRPLLFVFLIVFFLGFAVATHNVATSAGGTSYNVLEDVGFTYNISVNNTDNINPATQNITEVNITIPSSFAFLGNSNGTSASIVTFTNSTTVLSWNKTGALVAFNSSRQFFFFNATAATPGNYNITVQTRNSTIWAITNISIIVNDTTVPSSVEFADPSLTNSSSVSRRDAAFNVSVSDNGVVGIIMIRLYNSTNDILNTTISSAGAASYFVNYTGLSDGVYYVNSSANDTYNNVNLSLRTTFTIDNAGPSSVSFSCDPDTVSLGGTVTCTCSASDSIDSSPSLTYTASPDTDEIGEFSLTCTARDDAGNSATSSEVEYAVTGGSGGGGGSGPQLSPGSTDWKNTYDESDKDITEKKVVSGALEEKQRIKIKLGSQTHSVGVLSLSAEGATIEVASTPRQTTLRIGESSKFDLNDDNYYDIQVTLQNIVSGKANVFVSSIRELIVSSVDSSQTDNQVTTTISQGKRSGWVWAAAFIVVAGVVAWFVFANRKQTR